MQKSITVYTDINIRHKLDNPELYSRFNEDITPAGIYSRLFKKTNMNKCFRSFGEKIEYRPEKINVISIQAAELRRQNKVTFILEKR